MNRFTKSKVAEIIDKVLEEVEEQEMYTDLLKDIEAVIDSGEMNDFLEILRNHNLISGNRKEELIIRELYKFLIILNVDYWHSEKGSGKYHECINCPAGNNIEPEYIKIGKGGYKRCIFCQRRIDKRKCL